MRPSEPCWNWNAQATSLSSWREIVRDTLNDIDFQVPDGAGFTASMSCKDLLGTRFVRIAAARHCAANHNRRVRRSGGDHILLSLIEEGEAKIRQGEREVALQAGDMAIYDTGGPYRFIADRPFVQTVLRIERDDLARRVSGLRDFTARRISGSSSLGRIAAAHMCEVHRQLDHIAVGSERLVQKTMLDIIACALFDVDPDQDRWTHEHQHLLLQRVAIFVEDNLFDSALTCEVVASAIGISQRYLRKLCSSGGYSLSERILERRLEEASQRLSQSGPFKASITCIAYDCGFKDPAHFSRAFKMKFGMTPREYRHSFN